MALERRGTLSAIAEFVMPFRHRVFSLLVATITLVTSSGHCKLEHLQHRLADGCRHVYVDMGTNIGHQIRKVYQPELYPKNPTEELFLKYFGKDRGNVCAFGFEANPVHEPRLKLLEKSMQLWGKRVHIFTSTAVSVQCTNVTFYEDPGAALHNQWGASLTTGTIADKNSLVSVTVPSIDIAVWMKNAVLSRYIPPGALNPSIVMKSDIENHDMVVLSHLLSSGVLCDVSLVYGEHMTEVWLKSMNDILHLANCSTVLRYLDDESGDNSLPLPVNVTPSD